MMNKLLTIGTLAAALSGCATMQNLQEKYGCHGLGSAEEIKNMALLRSTAKNRARADYFQKCGNLNNIEVEMLTNNTAIAYKPR